MVGVAAARPNSNAPWLHLFKICWDIFKRRRQRCKPYAASQKVKYSAWRRCASKVLQTVLFSAIAGVVYSATKYTVLDKWGKKTVCQTVRQCGPQLQKLLNTSQQLSSISMSWWPRRNCLWMQCLIVGQFETSRQAGMGLIWHELFEPAL